MPSAFRPSCPYPCAGSYCPYIRSDAECIACEARPALDAHFRELEAWHRAKPPSLKEQALEALQQVGNCEEIDNAIFETIRRAIHALND